MKRLIVPAAVLCACVSFTHASTPQVGGAKRMTIDQLIDIKHPSNPVWSPDGRRVAFNWERAGVSKIYVSDVAAPNPPRELPVADATLAGGFWSRDGRTLFVPKGGDLWRVPVDGGD